MFEMPNCHLKEYIQGNSKSLIRRQKKQEYLVHKHQCKQRSLKLTSLIQLDRSGYGLSYEDFRFDRSETFTVAPCLSPIGR